MFASLKNKIKEETGNDIQSIPPTTRSSIIQNRRAGRLSSTTSIASTVEENFEQKDTELNSLRSQYNELSAKYYELNKRFEIVQEEKNNIERANQILLESVKVAQNQKDLVSEEQEKIQNCQYAEIEKLKGLLSFREQQAVDHLATVKQNQQQIENLTAELERLKILEPMLEDLKDELERLRHASQLDKNNLTTTLAAVDEENRHLKMRLQIIDQSRLESISTMSTDEKFQALIHERKLLEQRLEEAHLQLSDIKSSWSGQNLALETQVSRLSRQVAEETTEKRKALKMRDDYSEKIKSLEFDLINSREQIEHRDNKIKLLEEEIDELNLALRECREESEEEILCVKNKLEQAAEEIQDLKIRLSAADERLNDYVDNSEQVTLALRKQITLLQEQITNLTLNLDTERQEKNAAILRIAELSQSEEILRKDLRIERDECNELHEKVEDLQQNLNHTTNELNDIKQKSIELNTVINNQSDRIAQVDSLTNELNEKNKSIKILNQRLTDLKKTIQSELQCKTNSSYYSENNTLSSTNTTINLINSEKNCNNIEFSKTSNGLSNSTTNSNITCNFNNNSRPQSVGSNSSGGVTGGPIIMDEVNFKYLKHVIVKFLTSREVEARHLIRAVATLLHLTTDEEKLLHDTLNWKMSWFGTKPDHRSGLRAFSIPPS
ncbi:golgin subfamily A member 1 [Condylostylus longicornis]|uniref:golgin subfamily A member 1 n=1 Tax=Condylostylus longicornis TaxID=2530218 RepID=UPI00244E113E|nr:golgin subfamily A member 1 [Condylostylus longicornis]